jgi:uroporphyrinogen decarboxylase
MSQENIFQLALERRNYARPPVWFMRQAGRYHAHYQALRAKHGFVDLCKIPELACETTMGPIRDFDFDAAILFSDILFPLESMGMPLKYDPAPQFGWLVKNRDDVARLNASADVACQLMFQRHALDRLKVALPQSKALIGFVGAPLTLYVFATEGSHRQGCADAMAGLKDGRFDSFMAKLMPVLLQTIRQQADAGINALALFDTCAGELNVADYRSLNVPLLREIILSIRRDYPKLSLIYYGKNIAYAHWRELEDLDFQCLGVDWNTPIVDVLEQYGDRWAIQGNFDPHWLRDDRGSEFEARVRSWFGPLKSLPESKRAGWICGLGHGVLPLTPEQNVRTFLAVQRELFS